MVHLLGNSCNDFDRCNLVNDGDGEQVWIADEDVAPGIYLTSSSSNPDRALEKTVLQVEENNSRSFDIWLSREPTSPVTVTLIQSGDSHLVATPTSHKFTRKKWGSAFTVNVEAQADADSYDGVKKLTFRIETNDPLYGREKLSHVFLSEKDTDPDQDGRRTYDQTEPDVTGGITVSLTHAPWRHNGKNFWVWLTFSEAIKNGRKALANALETEGMAVRRAQRVFKDSSRWAVELRPGQPHFLTHLVVRGGRNCGEEHAICTRGGKRLANTLTVSIAGSDGKDAKLPPGTDPAIPVVTLTGDIVSEADSHGTFTIQIDRPAPQDTTVEFGVYGVSAEEGKDFTGVPDQVIEIEQGTSEASVKVPLIDDQVTEHAEVLKGFITNAVGADLDVPANQDPLTAEILIRDNEEQPAGVDYVTGDTSSKNGIAVGDSWLNGDPVPGRIETENDEDWYVTKLRAGRCYQIEIRGKADAEYEHPGAEGLTLTDPYLRGVYRDDGVYLPGTTNRDGGADLSALHTIRFNRTGTYYIAVSHGWYDEGGTFDLSVHNLGARTKTCTEVDVDNLTYKPGTFDSK